MKKNVEKLTIDVDSDLMEKLSAQADSAGVSVEDYASDILESNLPQKRVYGKRAKKRHEVLFTEKMNDVIRQAELENADIKEPLNELQEIWRILICQG